jgi:hypothetical protein
LKKLVMGGGIAIAMIAVAALTVIDHLFIGALVFVGMILMVATGPRSREAAEESDMAKARRNLQQRPEPTRDRAD